MGRQSLNLSGPTTDTGFNTVLENLSYHDSVQAKLNNR
jgi:hypothetical protein